MAEFKEKGHDLDVSSIVVHKINKIGGQKTTALKLAEKNLKIGKQELHFVADIRKSFQNRSKPTYGVFDVDNTFNHFHLQLKKYITGEVDFLTFSQQSMAFYESEISKSAPATGAFVVFSDYTFTGTKDRYLLIFSINNKQSYNLSETDLTIKHILSLDLSKLDVAALLNITRWQKHVAGKDEEIRTYLSFIKGKKNLSDYFLDFIGCADKSTNADSSKLLRTALNKYLDEKGYSLQEKKLKRKAVYEYCMTCIREKREVLLDQISYLLNEEDHEEFSRFASVEEYGVGEIIKPDNKILKSLQYIDFHSEDLIITFNKTKLVKKEITYNRKSQSLTINNLPADLIKQLEQDE
jgi:nucleoid-associated protein